MGEQGNKRGAAGSQEEPFVDVLEKEEEAMEEGEGKEGRGRRRGEEGGEGRSMQCAEERGDCSRTV